MLRVCPAPEASTSETPATEEAKPAEVCPHMLSRSGRSAAHDLTRTTSFQIKTGTEAPKEEAKPAEAAAAPAAEESKPAEEATPA